VPQSLVRLTSRQHPLVQRCRALARGRGRDGSVLLEGAHLLKDAVDAGIEIEAVLVASDATGTAAERRVPGQLARNGVAVYEGSDAVLDAASPTAQPSGWLAIARWSLSPLDAVFSPSPALVIALAGVQDPGNLGAIIRSADAFEATGVIADSAGADPASWKALRGSMGSTFRLPVARATLPEMIDAARRAHVAIVAAAAQGGSSLTSLILAGSTMVILGGEGAGLPEDALPPGVRRVSVPMRPGVESLNVAVTAALILYEARAQRERGLRP
jgi:TrmH family RNA methyltransferase